MTKDEIKKIISYLLGAYPKTDLGDIKATETHFRVWEDVMKVFPYEIAQKACKEYIHQGGNKFPPIGDFVVICDEIWEKQSSAALKPLAIEEMPKGTTGLAKDCLKLIRQKLNGEVDLKTYIDGARKLDVKYPGIGFDKSVFELSKMAK